MSIDLTVTPPQSLQSVIQYCDLLENTSQLNRLSLLFCYPFQHLKNIDSKCFTLSREATIVVKADYIFAKQRCSTLT